MNSMENWLIAHPHIPAHSHRTCLVLRMSIVFLWDCSWLLGKLRFLPSLAQDSNLLFVCVHVCIFVCMHRCGYMFVHVCICIMYNTHIYKHTQIHLPTPKRTTLGDLGQISSRFSYQFGVCQVGLAGWPMILRKSPVYTCLVLGSQTYNTTLAV